MTGARRANFCWSGCADSVPHSVHHCAPLSVTLAFPMTRKGRVLSISVALIIHAVVYSLALHPMLAVEGDSGMPYLLSATLLYFPISGAAWCVAFATHSTAWFVISLAIIGGLYYAFLGYVIGYLIEARCHRRAASRSIEGQG